MLLLLRWAPRALKGDPSDRQHLLGVGREDSEWVRRATKGALSKGIEIRGIPGYLEFARPSNLADVCILRSGVKC